METAPAPPASTIDVTNPATGEVVEAVELFHPDQVPAAAARARAAQVAWAAAPWRDRAAVISRFHDRILRDADLVIETIRSESGKTHRDALMELMTVAGTARYYLAHGRRHLAEHRGSAGVPFVTSARTAWRPHGLIGLITPWNFPFILGVADALPALLAGNAVLTKPSELTPRSTLLARELLVDCGLDPALFQPLVGSGGDLGAPIIDAVDYVGFTGSTAVGRIVAERAASRLIPCSLELGGKNPMLVLPGARVQDAVSGLVSGAFVNAGQTCISIERAYVHESIWDEFVAEARSRVERLEVGWSQEWDPDLGSLSSVTQAERVRAHVRDAVDAGATLLAGTPDGSHALGDAFVTPTLLTDTTEAMAIHAEETFGPVVRLERVASESEAIAKANASDLGLNASVWAGSRRAAMRVARQLEVGTVNINSTLLIYGSFSVPMGGIRRSGIGRRHGASGIQRYCRQLSIVGSFGRGGGIDGLIGVTNTHARARRLIALLRLWRRIPGLR
ncbi:MAG: gabD2 [Thermoleophilia bacterium]|nr:gabD2 [Thermoleophilia bacterium]